MPGMHTFFNEPEKAGRSVGTDRLPVLHTTGDWTVATIDSGMVSGGTSIGLLLPVNVEGVPAVVVAETSLTAWMLTSAALAARYEAEVGRPGFAKLSPAARAMLLPRYVEAIRRAIPSATDEQAHDAASMMLDSLGSGDGLT